jgi:hypothetical protein
VGDVKGAHDDAFYFSDRASTKDVAPVMELPPYVHGHVNTELHAAPLSTADFAVKFFNDVDTGDAAEAQVCAQSSWFDCGPASVLRIRFCKGCLGPDLGPDLVSLESQF